MSNFHIHGDNIVECERAVFLIRQSLADITTTFTGPVGHGVCPSYRLTLEGFASPLVLTLFPGFNRWNHNILHHIRNMGGTLREAADVIITSVVDGNETLLIAIEYCSALPAGNQAWQRSGRAYSFGKAQVPYLYVAELSGYELGANRVRKAARLPNPAVPFSYISFSLTNGTPVLPVFVTSPGADATSRVTYADVFADKELVSLMRAIMLGQDAETTIEALRLKALAFIEIKANSSRAGTTLNSLQWQQACDALENGQSLVDFLVTNARISWSKTTSIPLTPTAKRLMRAAATHAIGLTAKDLPMCIVPRDFRLAFADSVEQLKWLRFLRHEYKQ